MDKVIEILDRIVPDVNYLKEQNLVDNKILSSINIIKLVYELNEEFDIKISPMHLIPENFNSAEAIYNLVQRLEED
jgi:acyl carrier protein